MAQQPPPLTEEQKQTVRAAITQSDNKTETFKELGITLNRGWQGLSQWYYKDANARMLGTKSPDKAAAKKAAAWKGPAAFKQQPGKPKERTGETFNKETAPVSLKVRTMTHLLNSLSEDEKFDLIQVLLTK